MNYLKYILSYSMRKINKYYNKSKIDDKLILLNILIHLFL